MQNCTIKKSLVIGISVIFLLMSITTSFGIRVENKPTIPISNDKALYVDSSGEFNYTKIQDAIDKTSKTTKINKIDEEQTPIYPIDGLAPEASSVLSTGVSTASKEISIGSGQTAVQPFVENMYGYTAALGPHGEGPCYWDKEAPSDIEQLSTQTLPNFAAGGTYTCDGRWIVCEYSNGALYEIDPETGDISDGWGGSGGSGLNGLAEDPTSQTMYGCSSNDLYLVDVETGDLEYIGPFGISDAMIGLTFDMSGVCYGWDVKFSGNSKLYTIDLEEGTATEKWDLGFNLLYAQDGEFNRADELIYLSAYSGGGKLITVDPATGDTNEIGGFENNAEITGTMIMQPCIQPEHDIGIKNIGNPVDGYATEDMNVEVTVKNYGNNHEYTDVQFEIIKCEEGAPLDTENFTGTFPPAGWTTYYWKQSNSNYAGGEPPEAHVKKHGASDGIENYISTRPINTTGFEKINVKFRLYLDACFPQNTYFYLQYRKNTTSPWIDASPWSNPIGTDLGPKNYEVGFYDLGEPLGGGFQVRWMIQDSYYPYWNDIFLDDFEIYGCTGCAEYTDLAEDVYVQKNEEIKVKFTNWTPSQWHNEEFVNTWEEYSLKAFTTFEDNNTRNDRKQHLLSLYYPFLHDVGTFDMEGPQDGPAQTFPVIGAIKNVGQYDEYNIKTFAEVAEINYSSSDQIFSYNFSSCYPWPPTGWTMTDSNWRCSYSSDAEGSNPELRFYYYPISYPHTYRFASPSMDTSNYGAVNIQFKHINTDSYGKYKMKVQTSNDGATWDTVWETQGKIEPETVSITTGENVGGSTFYIAFVVETISYSVLYWSIDDIVIDAFPLLAPEYEDQFYVSDLEVGQELIINFNAWTPIYLAKGKSGKKTYKARVWTDLQSTQDEQRTNDEYAQLLTLDYFHNVGVQKVSSPIGAQGYQRRFFAVDSSGYPGDCRFIRFDPVDPGSFDYISNFPTSNFPHSATFDDDQRMWFSEKSGMIWYKEDPMSNEVTFVGNSGIGELTGIAYHEVSGKMYGCSPSTLYEINTVNGDATEIGSFGCSGIMISIDCDREGNMYGYDLNFRNSNFYSINLETGNSIVIGNIGFSACFGQDMAYDWEEEKMYATVFDYNTWHGQLREVDLETGEFIYIDDTGPMQLTCFAIPCQGITLDTYVTTGTYPIEVIVENLGTFQEEDMTCTADLYEYITDCENATFLEEWTLNDVEINEPLTGEEELEFGNFTFIDEGFYGLFLNLTDDDDDYPNNNIFSFGIGVDDSAPSTSHTLNPEVPDGENGWYVSDLEVTVTAIDPSIGCERAGSGIDYIAYEIDGVPGQVPGSSGTFTITVDGNDILVEYWAVDMVGNAESRKSFTIDMDQKPPNIDLTYEWEGTEPPWIFHFIANATDATSDMERVEFYINGELQETIYGPGPEYIYTIPYIPPPHASWSAAAFDMAGNYAYDFIYNPPGNIEILKSFLSQTSTSEESRSKSCSNDLLKSEIFGKNIKREVNN